MKNLTKILLSCGVALATLPMAAAGCFDFPTECETDADCVEPETCNTTIGVCEGAEGEGEGEGEGEDVSCSGDFADDSEECLEDRPGSLDDPYLCDGTICVEPNELTANCAGANAANLAYDGGPVFLDVTELSDGNDGDTCAAADGGYNAFIATVYSEVAFNNNLNSALLHYINGSGTVTGTYSEVGLLPEAEAVAGADGYYTLSFYLCGDGGTGAVHVSNNDGDSGNTFCMDLAD